MKKLEEEIKAAMDSVPKKDCIVGDKRLKVIDIDAEVAAAAEVAKRYTEKAFNDGILLGWDAKEKNLNFRESLEKYHQWLIENGIVYGDAVKRIPELPILKFSFNEENGITE